jgi:hypothetical protein
MGKVLIGIGIVLILIGMVMTLGPKIYWIGKILGDIFIFTSPSPPVLSSALL